MTTVKPTLPQLRTLVGNPDVYAVQHDDGTWSPVREPLTDMVLRRHRKHDITVGTYIVKPPDLARTLVFDIDDGNDQTLSDILDALSAVQLEGAVEFSGKKGWHVWVVAEDYLPAEVLYRIGRGIREEAGHPDLEVFPKQTEVRDLGNLVKLPGGMHRVTRKQNDFITHGLSLNTMATVEGLTKLASMYPEVGLRKRKGEAPEQVQYPCVYGIQDGVKEGGRNIHLFHLATMLRRFSITEENIHDILVRANERSPDGPLPDEELERILDNSAYSGPVCNQLSDEVHCGEQCILTKHGSLYTKPGSLRYAAEGETVTVEVGTRDETTIVLQHPDAADGRAILSTATTPRRKRGD